MSHSTVFQLFKTTTRVVEELSNSWGTGPALWELVSQKTTGKPFDIIEMPHKFWNSWQSDKLTIHEKTLFLLCCDYTYIELEKLEEFAASCFIVHDEIIKNTNWTWNHFNKIGELALNLKEKHHKKCKGLCLACTSVSDIWANWKHKERIPDPIYANLPK